MNQESSAMKVENVSQGDILVVDDTPANLRLLTRILQERNYQVRPVPDGSLALSAAQAKPPDLILLDIRMPEMDGFEVCAKLKSDPRSQDIPIIFISALDAVEDKVRAFSVGGVDYITKPFQSEEVIARVENHLNLRRLQAQLEIANAKMAAELALAGEVQSSFLPKEYPQLKGWQISVKMRSAHETTGDFFDVIALPRGYIGILMADVEGKGVAAALYMALSWSLIRTYSWDFPRHPEMTLTSINQRLVEDTSAKQHVSVFYGILDPESGGFIYCNAGLSPPLLVNSARGEVVRRLEHTGKSLGISEEELWWQNDIEIDPGEALVICTNGIPGAQNLAGDYYEVKGLAASARSHPGLNADRFVDVLFDDLQAFMVGMPQVDDQTMAALIRDQ